MKILHENANFGSARFFEIADTIAKPFVESTDPIPSYVPEGIIHSDGLCIAALCEMYEIDYLIESGRANAGSTEMFARYFANHPRIKHIWSIDLKVNRTWRRLVKWVGSKRYRHIHPRDPNQESQVRQRLAPFRDILSLVDGDAFLEIPKIMRKLNLNSCRVGVFIDGPKEEPQMRLANNLLDLSPNVTFAALDGVGPRFPGRYERFCKNARAVFCTSDDAFYSRYAWVNKGRLPPTVLDCGSAQSGVGVLINCPITPV
jgi:hypothetical protein